MRVRQRGLLQVAQHRALTVDVVRRHLDLDARAVGLRTSAARRGRSSAPTLELLVRHRRLGWMRVSISNSNVVRGLLDVGATVAHAGLAGRELAVHAGRGDADALLAAGLLAGGGTWSRRAACRRPSAICAFTMPGPLSSTVMRKRVARRPVGCDLDLDRREGCRPLRRRRASCRPPPSRW